MNTKVLSFVLLGSLLIASGVKSFSQEEATATATEVEASSAFDAGLDIYSSYVWRGLKFGSGPAFQPWVEGSFGNLAVGAWGSVNSGPDEAFEMDLYASYGFDFGLSLTVSDYYFGGDWMDFNTMHYIEPAIGYEIGGLGLMAAVMLNAGSDEVLAMPGIPGTPAFVNMTTGEITPGTDGVDAIAAEAGTSLGSTYDMYFEASYAFNDFVSLTVGAGDGAYTSDGDDTFKADGSVDEAGDIVADGDFMINNVTLGVAKEISITEKFALPLSGAVTLNPATGGFFATVGVSF